MDHPLVIVLLTLLGVAVVALGALFALGGNPARLGLALRVLRDAPFADKVQALDTPPPPPTPPKPSGLPVRILALLQRESRLIDFLLDNVQNYSDDQIGAAVRDIQPKAQAALKKYLVIEQLLPQNENDAVEVPPGFDPSAIQLSGNVSGQPPFKGSVRHPGWRVKEIKLQATPTGQDEFVLAPAEVELP